MRLSQLFDVIGSWWANQFIMTRLQNAGEGASVLDTVRLADADGDEPAEDTQLLRAEQFGDIRIAPNGTNAVILRMSDGGLAFSTGDGKSRPDGFKKGDRALYSNRNGTIVALHGDDSATPGAIEVKNATGASVIVDKDGNVRVNAAENKDVIVNGGAKKVSRLGDRTEGAIRTTWAQVSAVPPIFTLTLQVVDGTTATTFFQASMAGTVTFPPAPAVPVDTTLPTKITEGADHFKG